jgi:3-deoxy-D-arabino-heptulosonate 7-phosphate (DAHP) synthase class II
MEGVVLIYASLNLHITMTIQAICNCISGSLEIKEKSISAFVKYLTP